MAKRAENNDLVDSLYAVAMEPERLHELIDVWHERLSDASEEMFPASGVGGDFLKRHLVRAETILSLVLENEDVLPTPLQEKLNSEPQAVLALTFDGVIEALNPAAETLFDLSEGAKISDLPITEGAQDLIRKEVRRLSKTGQTDEKSAPGIFRLARDEDRAPLLITFSPWTTSGSRRFVLLKTTDFQWPDYLTPLIEKAFELTAAEAAVVKMIVEGNSVEKISEMRGTSIKTVRFQIRSIYAKTSTNNQSEFIRMAIGLTTLQLVDKDVLTGAYQRSARPAAQAYPLPEHRRLFSLSDGRIMDYAVFGPKDGKPCVFFHNEYFGDVWPARLASYAIKKSLRIILPARPYFARSSPYPKGVNTHDQFTSDLDVLLSSMNIKNCVHICQTSGGLYSFVYALTFPEKVTAIVTVAPTLPSTLPEDEEKMPKLAKFSAEMSRRPYILKFMTKSGWLYHNRVGSRQFMETMITNTAPDLEIINDDSNADSIVRGFQYGTSNGHLAFYHDFRCKVSGPWNKIADLSCPMYNIIGSIDYNSRAKRAERAIADGANIKIVMAEGGGEMLFFSHPELIVDTLVQAWADV